LGQKLFFEPRLSGDGTVACATCHDPAHAFTDGRPVSVGIHGRVGQRNAPTVLNALYNKTQFWDGRVNTLEQQAALPITNPFEMGSASIDDAVSRIAGDKDYQTQFMQAFGRDVNEQYMLSAIAAYERNVGFLRFSLRPFHRQRRQCHQRLGRTWLEIVQHQGPLPPLPCFDGRSAGRNPLHG
jgi:cytochrome c peroxidase